MPVHTSYSKARANLAKLCDEVALNKEIVLITRRNAEDVARAHSIKWRQPGTSHVTFRHPNGTKVTVPDHRPIKPIYIKKFILLVEEGTGG